MGAGFEVELLEYTTLQHDDHREALMPKKGASRRRASVAVGAPVQEQGPEAEGHTPNVGGQKAET